jgi:hypothetical protein
MPGTTKTPTIVLVLRQEVPNFVGFQFSKVTFADSVVPDGAQLPMSRSSHPLDMETASWFRLSLCPSIIMEDDCYECDLSFECLMESVGGLPSNPSNDTSSEFWADFREDKRAKRLMNISAPEVLPLPVLWAERL